MRLATLNVSGPSVARADRLLEFLPSLDADVLVLTETRENEGTRRLLNAYRDAGYAVVAAPEMRSSERGVALIQRAGRKLPVERALVADLPHRLVAVQVGGDQPITVVGAYVPSRDASPTKIARKQRFLAQMTALTRSWANEQLVFLGDLNIVSRQHLPRFSAFRSWEYDALDALELQGLVDAHELLYPGEQVHSWIGRKGAGYRYDYAFVSTSLAPSLVDCAYVHEPRELGLTDHAAVVLTLGIPAEAVAATRARRRPGLVAV